MLTNTNRLERKILRWAKKSTAYFFIHKANERKPLFYDITEKVITVNKRQDTDGESRLFVFIAYTVCLFYIFNAFFRK